ncbi:MAG: hypothetical protein ACTJHC_03360 [Vagococcus sp.]
MKKFILSVSLFFLFMLIMHPVEMDAAKDIQLPKGVIVGDEQGGTITKNGNYFFKLKELFPGDYISRDIDIENKRNEPYELEMEIEPLEQKGPVNLIKDIEMKMTYNSDSIFKGNLVSEDKNETQVGSTINFGKIEPGSHQTVHIDLHVNPYIPLSNIKAAESMALVRWHFNFKSISDKTPVTPITKPSTNPKRIGKLPQLGQNKEKILMALSGLMLLVTWILYVSLFKKQQVDHKKGT